MALEGSINPGDQVFEQAGVKVVLDHYTLAVSGKITIDYAEEPWRGFRIMAENWQGGGC